VWTEDPVYVRWLVEEMLAGRLGRSPHQAKAQLEAYGRRRREEVGYSPVAGVPEPGTVSDDEHAELALVDRIVPVLEAQTAAVEAELAAFMSTFEPGTQQLAREVLDESERRIEDELARYGVNREQVTVWRSEHDGMARVRYADVETRWSFAGGPTAERERAGLMAAARDLAVSERRVRELTARRDLVSSRLVASEGCEDLSAAGVDPLDDDLDASVDGGATLFDVCAAEPQLVGSSAQLRDLLGAVERALAHLQQEHAVLRAEKEGDYPVIASYTSGDSIDLAGLERLANAPSAAQIGEDAYEKLSNIRTVRERLADDPSSVYKLPQLLDLARARYHVAPGSPRDAEIRRRVAEVEDDGFWRSIGIMAVSIGLGLLAAIPTAGLSMGATVAVVGAEVAALALDAYLLYDSVRDYEVGHALTDTDFDRARALSRDEPSLFWLAVDLVGTAVGVAGAAHTFRTVAQVRRAALATRSAGDLAEQLAELRRLREAGELSASAAQRIQREILRDHPERAIAALLDEGAAALRPADEVAAAMGVAIGDAVHGDDLARLSNELGVAVHLDDALDVDVRVMMQVVDGRVARVRGVVIGPSATIGDVLAHRETVDLLRRMEVATESLGRSFDELLGGVVDEAGRVNPYPPGSAAFNSWFELRKYPEMIQQRLGRLGEDGVSRAERELLREQVSFFETELAHHRDVVARAVAERGTDFIARAARSNQAAFDAGWPRVVTLEDGRRFPIGDAGSQFYYAEDATHGFVLRRYVDAVDAPAISVRRVGGAFEVFEGALTREEAASALVRGWPEAEQGAFANAQRLAAEEYGGRLFRVVPLAGIHRMDTTVGAVLTDAVAEEMVEVLAESLARTRSAREARRAAREAVDALRRHPITVVRGTDQLRAFGYRRSFERAAGEVVEGDLHHWIPLYLGGDHRIGNLLDLDPAAHRRIHELLEGVTVADGVTLDPNQLGRLDVDFEHGVGILLTDGSVRLQSLTDYSFSMP
jgi:hypothetical protein